MSVLESVTRWVGWWLINVDMLLILLLVVGGLLLVFGAKKWGKSLVTISCVVFIFLAVVPAGFWSFEVLENRFPKIEKLPPDVTGIILLGGFVDRIGTAGRGEPVYNLAANRFIRFVELADRYPKIKLVFTGGGRPFEVTHGVDKTEAQIAKEDLDKMGFDSNRVIFESQSNSTLENAIKTKALIQPKPDQKWVLMTSAYHMPRSVGLFRKAGWNVIPYPVDYHTPGHYEMFFFLGLKEGLLLTHYAIREWVSMLQNYWYGRSDEIFPRPASS